MTRITDVFYGTRTTNLLLRKFWQPSTGLYPTDTTEGLVYIAEDAGTVGSETFSIGSMIVYKISLGSPSVAEWITVSGGAVVGGGGGVTDAPQVLKTAITIADDGVFTIGDPVLANSIVISISVNVSTAFVGTSLPPVPTLTVGNVTTPNGVSDTLHADLKTTGLYFKRAYFDVLTQGQINGTLDIDGSAVGAADILIEYYAV